jgi:hypothetical protein
VRSIICASRNPMAEGRRPKRLAPNEQVHHFIVGHSLDRTKSGKRERFCTTIFHLPVISYVRANFTLSFLSSGDYKRRTTAHASTPSRPQRPLIYHGHSHLPGAEFPTWTCVSIGIHGSSQAPLHSSDFGRHDKNDAFGNLKQTQATAAGTDMKEGATLEDGLVARPLA